MSVSAQACSAATQRNAVSEVTRAMDGIDTFVFGEDGFRVQTVRYILERVS